MFKRNSPDEKKKEKKKRSQHGMCKRNSPPENEASTGCLGKAPQIIMKPARDV